MRGYDQSFSIVLAATLARVLASFHNPLAVRTTKTAASRGLSVLAALCSSGCASLLRSVLK